MSRTMNTARRGGEAGFSLVEIIVAIAILSIGILAMVPMLAYNIRMNTLGRSYGFATYLAQEKLERIRSWPLYESATAANGINVANTLLFGGGGSGNERYETITDNYGVTYTRKTSLVRNGYYGATCGTNTVKFTATESGVDRLNEGDGSANEGTLNTGNVGVGCPGQSSYTPRGEDFKLVRVRVSWTDMVGPGPAAGQSGVTGKGTHEIERHMWVTGF